MEAVVLGGQDAAGALRAGRTGSRVHCGRVVGEHLLARLGRLLAKLCELSLEVCELALHLRRARARGAVGGRGTCIAPLGGRVGQVLVEVLGVAARCRHRHRRRAPDHGARGGCDAEVARWAAVRVGKRLDAVVDKVALMAGRGGHAELEDHVALLRLELLAVALLVQDVFGARRVLGLGRRCLARLLALAVVERVTLGLRDLPPLRHRLARVRYARHLVWVWGHRLYHTRRRPRRWIPCARCARLPKPPTIPPSVGTSASARSAQRRWAAPARVAAPTAG